MEAKLPSLTDEQLWSKLRMGDQNAFSELYKRHLKKLHAYGRKFTTDSEVIKDCSQDIFSDILQRPTALSETASVKMYLMKALRHRLLYHRQKQTCRPLHEQSEFNITPSIEDQLIESETIEYKAINTRRAIAKLTKRQQEIIYLKYYYSFDNRFIAEIMSLNYQTVCNLTSKSLKAIRKLMSN